jgi:Glu-tRNA(Gln) amidotransferase subunit E-like FAD-binding protein
VTCDLALPSLQRRPPRARRPIPSLIRTTLWRNGAQSIQRESLTAVRVESLSRIIVDNDSVVWCRTYRGLAGLFRKDRGPSKEFGRALCDEVKERFGCDGFLTTDELPRYGISRSSRRAIMSAARASSGDCVVLYAYPEHLAEEIDEYLHARLERML